MRMNKYWGTWIVFIGVFFHSCKQEVKQNNISFYSVDLLEMEKMKGEEILLSDLIESLDNREEALIATYSFGIDVSSNYILIEPDGVSALKLFTRKGRYVADIGGVGQGPGEYKYAVNRFLDEKQGRVAIAENKKMLFFDLKGQFLSEESISLPETITKSSIWIDLENEKAVVVVLPFADIGNPKAPISKNLCWVQDFKGNILQKISAINYAIVPDYSNEVLAPRNVDAYSFSLCQVVGRTRPDTLYHYDIANNLLKPYFTLDNVMQEDKYIVTSLYETPEYYWSRVTIGPAKVLSDGAPVRMTVFNVRVSKKDGSVKRIDRFTNDFLGLSYPFLTMRNGYVCITYEPLELMGALDKVLTQTDLEPDVRKRVADLRNSLHENDNDILIIGKLKQ